ncbi:G-protein coupled receptor family C group 5 member C-like [Chanos chanos]|uniref:G-protein coupled receptor family C group 5 member C-like n=1 Tax=Chanos chanos TaxID=29144 RepID=A0A6J2WPZ9_CHACN|nr:G-protein coupled receptor family C group 5 member C-like [Chanos chanos]
MTTPSGVPRGCEVSLNPIYFNLCDLDAVWGIVLESLAAAGVVASFVLMVILVASLPFLSDKSRRNLVALQFSFLLFITGLFGLTFAFIMRQDNTTCAVRRFLFGVLFAGCFSCLLVHGICLVMLERRDGHPRAWLLCLGAIGFWLVEVIINTEWMIITLVTNITIPCYRNIPGVTNRDFVMALIYVMALLLAVVLMAIPSLTHKHKPFRRDALYILLTGILSMSIWVTWIVMYVYGNRAAGSQDWDDPTLAIALVSNAWVFLVLYIIPEVCALTQASEKEEEPSHVDHLCANRSMVYENILRDQNLYMENKGFSMDEPGKLVSPYSGYNGQLRSCVYQPTELALITKGHMRDKSSDVTLPRAVLPSLTQGQ